MAGVSAVALQNRRERAQELADDGATVAAIAQELNVSRSTAQRDLDEGGVSRRPGDPLGHPVLGFRAASSRAALAVRVSKVAEAWRDAKDWQIVRGELRALAAEAELLAGLERDPG